MSPEIRAIDHSNHLKNATSKLTQRVDLVIVAFHSAKERSLKAAFAERKATIFLRFRLKRQLVGVVVNCNESPDRV